VSKIEKTPVKVTLSYRVTALAVFALVAGFFVFMWLGNRGSVDMRDVFGICGFKQAHGLPCPGCGMTTSAMAFVRGEIFQSFYIQPAAAVFCCVFVIAGVLSLLAGVFGVKLPFLRKPIGTVAKYVLIFTAVVIIGGWAVTLSRAMAR